MTYTPNADACLDAINQALIEGKRTRPIFLSLNTYIQKGDFPASIDSAEDLELLDKRCYAHDANLFVEQFLDDPQGIEQPVATMIAAIDYFEKAGNQTNVDLEEVREHLRTAYSISANNILKEFESGSYRNPALMYRSFLECVEKAGGYDQVKLVDETSQIRVEQFAKSSVNNAPKLADHLCLGDKFSGSLSSGRIAAEIVADRLSKGDSPYPNN